MRVITIPTPPNLPTRWNRIHAGRVNVLATIATHESRSSYIKRNPSWNVLKTWLASISNKCWYCETKSVRAPFDVDHFRPKLGVTVNRIELAGHSGYHWLAYDWANFRLSCQRCNRPERDESDRLRGKANEFPIKNEAHRWIDSASKSAESATLLDPCVETDCALLAHGLDGEIKPVASAATWDCFRARYTIDLLGLNAWNVPETKRARWQTLATLLTIVGYSENSTVVQEVRKHIAVDHEYSSFFRSAIGTHRDKSWIEDLL